MALVRLGGPCPSLAVCQPKPLPVGGIDNNVRREIRRGGYLNELRCANMGAGKVICRPRAEFVTIPLNLPYRPRSPFDMDISSEILVHP